MNTPETLFAEFPPVSRAEWKAKAIEDLKGADFDKKLVWKTDESFTIEPFYTAEDIFSTRENQQTTRKPGWKNYVEINVASDLQANKLALELKNFGAEGFLFKLDDPANHNIEMLLQGLDPVHDEISFSLGAPSPVFLSEYLVYLNRSVIRAPRVKGFYECDILENWSLSGQKPRFRDLADLLVRSKPYPGFRCLVVRSHSFVNAGANVTQELAYTLHKLSDYIEALLDEELSLPEILDELVLHFAIGGDYFFEIAKLRAVRIILGKILNFYGCTGAVIPIVCSGSSWTKSCYDINVNMLRNTTEAMSAVIGGCDALIVAPHDASVQQPSGFSRRIALNVGNILKEEAWFGMVNDPAAGSYYIKTLTDKLVDSTLAEFREIEAKGGYITAFRNGIIQDRIRQQRERKEKEIATRKRVFVGANKFSDKSDQHVCLQSTHANTSQNGLELLPQQHATTGFEELRKRTLLHFKRTGFVPEVQLLCFGNLVMRKARAGFAEDFFSVAGFRVMEEIFFTDNSEATGILKNSTADIIVFCSSDEEYCNMLLPFVNSNGVNSDKILIVAGYPEAGVDQLRAAGIAEFIHMRCDAVGVLGRLQDKLMV